MLSEHQFYGNLYEVSESNKACVINAKCMHYLLSIYCVCDRTTYLKSITGVPCLDFIQQSNIRYSTELFF